MAKGLFAIFVVLFSLLLVSKAEAFRGFSFGGKIGAIDDGTNFIRQAESDGSDCKYTGNIIEVTRKNSSQAVTLLIPSDVVQKSRYGVRGGQWILGLHYKPINIQCTKPGDPPTIKIITLSTVNIFGTSR